MPKKPEVTQNDRLRQHLEGVKDNIDLTTASGRRKSMELYMADNPDANPSALPAAHHSMLMKKAKEWGKSPSDFKAGSRGQKKLVDPKIRATIRPTPSGIGEGKGDGPNWRDGKGQEPPREGERHGKIPNSQPPPPGTTYTPRAAGAVLNCVYNVLRIPRPYADKLDADDRESLGEIWAPIFNRHLVGHDKAEIGVALVATAGFFSQKIIDSDGENRAKYEAEMERKKREAMRKAGVKEVTPEAPAQEGDGPTPEAEAARKKFGKAAEGKSDF